MGKNILNSLKLILPIAALILIPWAITLTKPEWRDSSFGTIWVSVTSGLFFLLFLSAIIYGAVSNKDLTKSKLWVFIFGK